MNFNNLMAQANKMKKDIEKKQEEINSTLYSSKNEFVTVEMYGSKKVHKINIDSTKVQDSEDISALEDMILIAVNDCINKINADTDKKLGSYANGLGGLF